MLAWFLADADPRAGKVVGCILQQAAAYAEGATPQACRKRSAAHGTEAPAGPADMDSVLADLRTVDLADPDQQAAVQQEFEKEEKATKDGCVVKVSQTAKRCKVPKPGHDSSDDESSSGKEDEQEEEEQGDGVGKEKVQGDKVQEEEQMAFV